MREHRQIYKATLPGNVPGCVAVGVIAMPTDHTQKLGLGFPVAFVDMPASPALAAGITGINDYNRNSGALGFVLYKTSKLAEAPVMQSVALLFSGLNLRSDMRQIFERNTEAGAFSSGNDCFGNTVILMLLKPLLLATHLAKAAFCCSSAYALQCRTAFGVMFTFRFNSSTGVLVAETISCNVDDAEINTKNSFSSEQFRVVKITNSSEIPLPPHIHKVNFTFSMFKQFALVVSTSIRNLFASRQYPKRNNIISTESENAVIVRLRRMLAESSHGFLVNLIRIGDFGNAAHCYLRCYLKLSAKVMIAKFMEIILAEYLSLKSTFGKPIASIITTHKCIHKHLFLLWSWL